MSSWLTHLQKYFFLMDFKKIIIIVNCCVEWNGVNDKYLLDTL